MNKLVWMPIPNYDGYMASSNGDISSANGNILSKSYTGNGYLKVKIARKTRTVHRLVLMAFNGVPDKEMVCNHKNGVKADNRIENLEWVTQSVNCLHSLKTKKPNNMKPIIDTRTGVFYESMREVCRLYNIKPTTMLMRLKRKSTHFIYA